MVSFTLYAVKFLLIYRHLQNTYRFKRGAELGTIALLANIIREMITLLLAPLIAKRFGPLAPISSGGATTMDTTLPIITQSVGQRYVALSIYHGFVTDFTVPFLVTMWCTI